ncbi:MAG: hypothetical protein R3E01_36605 [Pirellulaceae bacterium]|nr:hypothetical protein [Planctomycetales bacterium]
MNRASVVETCLSGAVCLASVLLLGTLANAQIDVPFQIVSGEGTVEALPDPANPEKEHIITAGTATLGGEALNYTGMGRVRLLGAPDATGVAPFDSGVPFVFDFGADGTLEMHYGHPELGAPDTARVQLTPVAGGLVDTTWLATFNPVPGSGTGKFANVTGGAFLMTAETDEFDPAATNIPYSWSSDVGFLTFVPEPSSLAMCSVIVPAFIRLSRRRHVMPV